MKVWLLPLCLLTALATGAAHAVDTVHFSARSIESPLFRVENARVALRPTTDGHAALEILATHVMFASALGEYRNLTLACADTNLNGPAPGCARALLTSATSPVGALRMRAALGYRIDRERFTFRSSEWSLAGGRAAVTADVDNQGWYAELHSTAMPAKPLRTMLAPYATLPNDLETDGSFDFDAKMRGATGTAQVDWRLSAGKVNFTDPDGTMVGENLAFLLAGNFDWPRGGGPMRQRMELTSSAGQALLGPALFDLKANPLHATGGGDYDGKQLRFATLKLAQSGLLEANGHLDIDLEPKFQLANALLVFEKLEFPAAYTSFVQLAAAATVFGDLKTSGTATATVRIVNGSVSSAELSAAGLDLQDRKDKFRMQNLRGELHWRGSPSDDVPVSWLSWDEGGSYGLKGGAARVDFRTAGRGFQLVKPARIPIFDGGLRIDLLAIDDIGLESMRGSFEGEILPIGMPHISQAFGWPELAGTLGGSIPRVEYRDKLVQFSGDVVARVFGGRITGSKMRLQDPLGPWPRFFADVKLEALNLAMVTDTFSIGSITGNLEGEIKNMELFNWSPVSFDAALRTPRGDKAPHRISAKAIGTLSDIGNNGGGGYARLQQGVLKFFDEYDYDRIGIRCQLANETCAMSGIEPAGIGYYILQGKGLPRINIIGNAGKVNWPALVGQIGDAMRSSGKNIKVRK